MIYSIKGGRDIEHIWRTAELFSSTYIWVCDKQEPSRCSKL